MKPKFKKGDLIRMVGFSTIGVIKEVKSTSTYSVIWFNSQYSIPLGDIPEAFLGLVTESWA